MDGIASNVVVQEKDPATRQTDVLEMLNLAAVTPPKAEMLEDAAALVEHACPLE